MKTDQPTQAGETPGPFTISASQLSTYADCPRKWAFDKLDGVPRGDTAATNEGKLIHAQVEAYYKTGEVPARPEARAALTHMPPRERPGLIPEMLFEFVWPGLDCLAHGFVDLAAMVDREVHDLKTVSNLKRSQKTPEELRLDAQAVLYSTAVRVLTRSMDPVTLQWTYVVREQPKTRAPKTEPVRLVHTAADAEEGLAKWTPIAAEILKWRKQGGRALDVLPNTDACVKYGPCQYRDLCPDYAGHAKKPEPEVAMSPELLARLAAASGAPMPVRAEPEAESPRAPTDEITQDPNRPTPPKMALLDTLRVDLGVKPAVVPPDAQPDVTPEDPPPPPPEPVVEKPKRRGRPPKAPQVESLYSEVAQTPEPTLSEAVRTVGLFGALGPDQALAGKTVVMEAVKAEDAEQIAARGFTQVADDRPIDNQDTLAEVVNDYHKAVKQGAKFTYESTKLDGPKELDIRAPDFDLEAFVESVCDKASRVEDIEIQLQAARIAVDLLAVRKG